MVKLGAVGGVAGAVGVGDGDPVDLGKTVAQSKGVMIAFLGLGVVISVGTAVYAATESLKFVDALCKQ